MTSGPLPTGRKRMDDTTLPDPSLWWHAWRVSNGMEFATAEWASLHFKQVIAPHIKVRVYGGLHPKYVDRPLIGGYVCIGAADENVPDSWQMCPADIFQKIEVPSSAAKQFCAELADLVIVAESDPYGVTRSHLKAGDAVRVKSGPLLGIEGVVESSDAKVFNVIVACKMLNTGVLVSVRRDRVEFIGSGKREKAGAA